MADTNKKHTGMLYLCATPIGNLEDITLRALRILKEADLVAAEDTRNSIRLLNHYDIHTPLTSYHEHNRIEKAYELIRKMEDGAVVCLITDAGMPAISDPGEDLVRICYERGISVSALPGATAGITALALSGLPTGGFVFDGFLPRAKKEREAALLRLKEETRTIILYEAPHRLRRTLNDLAESLGERKISLCRELTKRYETVMRMTIPEAIRYYEKEEPRGEYVLVIAGMEEEDKLRQSRIEWEQISLEDHMQICIEQGMEKKEAMKQVAKDRGISKRDVYQALLENK